MHWRAGLIVVLLALPAPRLGGAGEQRTIVDTVSADPASGSVHIRYRDRTTITAPTGRKQKSLSLPALADDRQTVGWLANYDSCCQSYPIPRQLVIWQAGRIVRRIDAAAMIWRWRFYHQGKEVGFSDGPTHGTDLPYSYKLYAVATGKLIGDIDGHATNLPQWAVMLVPEHHK